MQPSTQRIFGFYSAVLKFRANELDSEKQRMKSCASDFEASEKSLI